MPLVPRPTWEPLPDPPAPDPATATEFQSLAAEVFDGFDPALDQAGLELAALDAARAEGDAAAVQLGLDLVASAAELGDMEAEAAPDTLVLELAAAASQDAALAASGSEVGGLLDSGGSTPAIPAGMIAPPV